MGYRRVIRGSTVAQELIDQQVEENHRGKVVMRTVPKTRGMSLLRQALTKWVPRPGMTKSFSTTKEPTRILQAADSLEIAEDREGGVGPDVAGDDAAHGQTLRAGGADEVEREDIERAGRG